MQVICLEEVAFYALVEQVVTRLKENQSEIKDKWLSDQEAMQLLNIKSKTTLQKLRDEGKIRYSQPQKKIILYDRDSIEAYLNKNARNTF
ncbi:helix-turn-helix domain-containing protein [Dyadobacter sp. LHD-138]|uniref:helix-turn-helix domain-containing protein n=1 Tax=Dyadobacter sp. LHD-138 TaxID=3071413 RepID=UPI0027E0D3C6|nr:helix-turn-helix domain-containing protein [Dyadobacter sp. LHD-138]MDQ6482160.1 helix-turn-helix domain-containing protein [Dyadobacter sp. LHD-138]